eukprot:TRINITY_DN8024_c0_g1_i1.p1 TRINITY_DN8024_c0_g1~~TRINITY_DN8024_c0_g1_i1.p1  ORF type:complete len:556 (+),score=133.77 TRINITY_DN8024_c0_g1_i1:28-1668(+)
MTEEPNTEPQTRFSLDLLSTIKNAQVRHGLLQSDFLRYRKYCSNRVSRLRHGLGITHGKKKYAKRNFTSDVVDDARYLELLLMYAERAWALATALEDEFDNPRAKFHRDRRMAKAIKWAKKLLSFCQDVGDKRAIIEATSYYNWLVGTKKMQFEQWEEAYPHFIIARYVYEEIKDTGTLDQQQLCRERVEEMFPLIRFCLYNLGDNVPEDSVDQELKDMVAEVVQEEKEKGDLTLNEVVWNSNRYVISNTTVRKHLLKARNLKQSIPEDIDVDACIDIYSKIIQNYHNALQAIQKDIKSIENNLTNERIIERMRIYKALAEYVQYFKSENTIERNFRVALIREKQLVNVSEKSKLRKIEDILKSYDTILNNVAESGRYYQDEENNNVYGARIASVRAMRCYYKALECSEKKDYLNALALFQRSSALIRDARRHWSECTTESVDQRLLSHFNFIEEQSSSETAFTIAAYNISRADIGTAGFTQKRLLDNLQNYDTTYLNKGKIIDFPPDYVTIAASPVLVDISKNNLQIPDLTEKKKKKGFFSSIWG